MRPASLPIALARQPILARDKTVAGYELLYRGIRSEPTAQADPDHASASVALGAMTELGLDRVVGDRRAWINVPRSLILNDGVRALPVDRVVVELLEDQLVDADLLAALQRLRDDGYTIALDDYELRSETEALLAVADIVKLDFLALGAERFAADAQRIRGLGIRLLGEKIETREEFDQALAAGCDLVQGYFFCRPETLRTSRIPPNQLTALKLASVSQAPEVEIAELGEIITRDVGLSYRLLSYVNSAYVGLRHHVDSVAQATALLGMESVRLWLLVTSLAGAGDKPRELLSTALVRGRFCQEAGASYKVSASELFTLGMFSVLDALTDTPLEQIVAQLPFTASMADALIHRTGAGELLTVAESIEAGGLDVDPAIAASYTAALIWTTEFAQGMLD